MLDKLLQLFYNDREAFIKELGLPILTPKMEAVFDLMFAHMQLVEQAAWIAGIDEGESRHKHN